MQQSAAASASATPGSFASVLAAFSVPAPAPMVDWSEDDLGEDIATLSYEQALRTHARNRSVATVDSPRRYKTAVGKDELNDSTSGLEPLTATTPKAPPARSTRPAASSGAAHRCATSLEESRKAASITIRLSKAESAQLHQRAAEAGLTVSAYLRSCTLEVEALRAQVKEALTQLRPAAESGLQDPVKTKPHRARSWRAWLVALFPRWIAPRQASWT